MTIATDFLFIHVGEQEILGFGEGVGRAGVDVGQVVGKRADVMEVILGPARQVGAAELAGRPRDAEGRLVGAFALDGVFQGGAKDIAGHEFRHDGLLEGWEGG